MDVTLLTAPLRLTAGVLNGLVDPLLAECGIDASNFDSRPMVEWTQEHAEVPVFFVAIYLAIVFQGPEWLKNAPAMKGTYLMAGWNFLLSAFSFMGLINTVPTLLENLAAKGFEHTVCTNPDQWYLDGHTGLYVFLFIYSKIPELMDTVFLVLKKREVIFLHWFHHCTVLLYCWHAYHNSVAPGLWFAGMNYTVHSIMYFYYALMSLRVLRGFTKAVAPGITTIQIAQMVVGMGVTVASALAHLEGGVARCYVNASNYRMGFAMYASYFFLFAVLFRNLYCAGGKRDKKEFCGVRAGGDAAGHFMNGNAQNGLNGKQKMD